MLRAAIYAAILLWINAYICRELFYTEIPSMNSMHGFWIALAERAGGSWFHNSWWPYWDGGMPFEFTYSPLLPGLMAAWSAVSGISAALAFERITGIAYCLAPLTLFVAAWLMTRSPGTSFAASLLYSLTAPTQLLVPDAWATPRNAWDPRRLMLVAGWDDTPHLICLVFLPLTILFLARSLETRRLGYYAAAVVSIAAATMASAFGPVTVAMAAVCLLAALPSEGFWRNVGMIAGIGVFSYAMSAAFLPPSLIAAIRAASASHGESGFTAGSLVAVAMVGGGGAILWYCLTRWVADWRMRFFVLFAFLTSSIPAVSDYLHRQFLPQTIRYKMEMEMAIALVVAFAGWKYLAKTPVLIQRGALVLLILVSARQVVHQRRAAKELLRSREVTKTIEYRTSMWVEQNLPGLRVMLPGSIGQWADAFAPIPEFSGGSWSMAYNQEQQRGLYAAYTGGATAEEDARTSLAWLKAFGVGAVAVAGKDSQEYWKPYLHPNKFNGLLPALWREDDVTVYRIPQRSASLAHVIPEAALVRPNPESVDAIEPYVAALDSEALPGARFEWEGRNAMGIRASIPEGETLSIQVSYHPGWHAWVNGAKETLHRDGLGLMWLKPHCSGACEVRLDYDGGTELRACRYLSYAALAVLILAFPVRRLIIK